MRRPREALRTRGESDTTDDRGVTEVLGFILVFATILGSVGLLYMTGFQAMSDYQENEQLTNAERAMDSLADNFNDVARYDGVDQRYGELTLRGGTIRTGGESTTIEINTSKTDSKEIELGSLVYESGSDTIAYEGGGVFRGNGEGSAVIKQPPIRCSGDTVVISIVKLEHDDERSVQSSDGVGLTISEVGRERQTNMSEIESSPPTRKVTITVVDDKPYGVGWGHALRRNGWSDAGSGEYVCKGVDRLELQLVTAKVDY
ncbi:DUF7289 family protein [Halosolutus gelatinilyticus]|uniref:DUF7289 family protein n=1 Tax=Halosolutus gelatinilyticus TaxID=2931975 RepID=UPI001FF45C5A|nr:hypothetical protein [Halosolutus gelatinilyticus]